MFHVSRFTFHSPRPTCSASGTPHCAIRTPRSQRAFTMVEIAISLAIIGFALVAIIGVLPLGMTVQKDNREETIINQEATVFMNAIRNGAQGLDDLTNYVMAITNWATPIVNGLPKPPTQVYGYTYGGSYVNGTAGSPLFGITNGFRIIGLLSTPKYTVVPASKGQIGGVVSNYVVAYVRSMSGQAFEKFPQNDPTVQDLGFSYRLTSEVVPYWTNYFDPTWTDNPAYRAVVTTLQTNLHDLRLTFRWPLLAKGRVGSGGQSYRALVGGQLLQSTNDILYNTVGYGLYFFEPGTYTTNSVLFLWQRL